MKLEILVPQYKETEAVIAPLLDSIAIQQGVSLRDDVGVIICNDGSDTLLSEEFLAKYPFRVRYIKAEHRGVCATRNTLLDAASAEYIICCDADDMFIHACGLYMIFGEMEKGFDVFVSAFVEDVMRDGEHRYIVRQHDTNLVHGKVFRREHLVKHGIRWDERFTYSGDTYFLTLAMRTEGRFTYCPNTFYVWKWRGDSICRHERAYYIKSYGIKLDVDAALIEEFLRRKQDNEAQYVAARMVYDAYYTMTKQNWAEDADSAAKEAQFAGYYQKYRALFEAAPQDVKRQIIVNAKQNQYIQGIFMEPVTFEDWLNGTVQRNERG